MFEEIAKDIGNFQVVSRYSPFNQKWVIGISMRYRAGGGFTDPTELGFSSFGRGFTQTMFDTPEESGYCFREVCELVEAYEELKDSLRTPTLQHKI